MDTPNPIGVHARTKLEGETIARHNGALALRLASVFGLSPSMRWDNLVHDMTLSMYKTKEIKVYEPDTMRNLLHVSDLLEILEQILRKPRRLIELKGHVSNITSFADTKRQIASLISFALFEATGFGAKIDEDSSKKDYEQRYYFIPTSVNFKTKDPTIQEKMKWFKSIATAASLKDN